MWKGRQHSAREDFGVKYNPTNLDPRGEPIDGQPEVRSKKKPHLWVTILGVWLLCVVIIEHPLMAILFGTLSLLQRSSLVIFLVWINFAWLYGIYQLIGTIFVAAMPRKNSDRNYSYHHSPVAVLYTTMNDFSEDAATSCVNQNYSRFHVFILDDSTESQQQLQVDAFCTRFSGMATVIRRRHHEGYKAGNLNHALQIISDRYEFFAVCDADGILPPDFISKTMAHFTDDSVGFVQARQQATGPGSSSFATDLAPGIEIYWERILPSAQTFGFVMFHGHGGIIRKKLWSEIGGFPTLVAEDLAFSTRACEKGYIGVVADDVLCGEDFPSSYEAFSKRQLKYTRGAVEHLRTEMWSFLRSSKVTWYEKVDRLIASVAMISAFPLLVFLFNFALILPMAFAMPTNQAQGSITLENHLRLDFAHLPMFTWPFYLMTVIAMLAPLAPAVFHLRKHPFKLVRYLAAAVAVNLSLICCQSWDILITAITGKNSFPVTGDHICHKQLDTRGKTTEVRRFNIVNSIGLLALFTTAIVTANAGFLPICLAIGVGIVVNTLGWTHALVRVIQVLPLTVIILLIALNFHATVGLCGSAILATTPGF